MTCRAAPSEEYSPETAEEQEFLRPLLDPKPDAPEPEYQYDAVINCPDKELHPTLISIFTQIYDNTSFSFNQIDEKSMSSLQIKNFVEPPVPAEAKLDKKLAELLVHDTTQQLNDYYHDKINVDEKTEKPQKATEKKTKKTKKDINRIGPIEAASSNIISPMARDAIVQNFDEKAPFWAQNQIPSVDRVAVTQQAPSHRGQFGEIERQLSIELLCNTNNKPSHQQEIPNDKLLLSGIQQENQQKNNQQVDEQVEVVEQDDSPQNVLDEKVAIKANEPISENVEVVVQKNQQQAPTIIEQKAAPIQNLQKPTVQLQQEVAKKDIEIKTVSPKKETPTTVIKEEIVIHKEVAPQQNQQPTSPKEDTTSVQNQETIPSQKEAVLLENTIQQSQNQQFQLSQSNVDKIQVPESPKAAETRQTFYQAIKPEPEQQKPKYSADDVRREQLRLQEQEILQKQQKQQQQSAYEKQLLEINNQLRAEELEQQRLILQMRSTETYQLQNMTQQKHKKITLNQLNNSKLKIQKVGEYVVGSVDNNILFQVSIKLENFKFDDNNCKILFGESHWCPFTPQLYEKNKNTIIKLCQNKNVAPTSQKQIVYNEETKSLLIIENNKCQKVLSLSQSKQEDIGDNIIFIKQLTGEGIAFMKKSH